MAPCSCGKLGGWRPWRQDVLSEMEVFRAVCRAVFHFADSAFQTEGSQFCCRGMVTSRAAVWIQVREGREAADATYLT